MHLIYKQSAWLLLGQLISRIIGFFYTIYLAKSLGVESFGLYATALTFFSLSSSIADFGFSRFLIREIVLKSSELPKLLLNVTILRLVFVSVVFAIFSLILYSKDPSNIRVNLSLLAIMATLPQAIAMSFDSVFIALKKLQYSSIALVFLSVATTIIGIFLIQSGFGPTGAVLALVLGQVLYSAILFIFSIQKNVGVSAKIDPKTLKSIAFGSLPYGILTVLGLIYFRIDTILLSYMKGNFETGIYSAGYKFLESLVFIPSALASALFPVLTKLHEVNPEQIKKVYFKSIKVMGLLSLVIVAAYLFLLPVLINIYLPSYSSSIEVIKVLALTVPFMFIHVPGAQVLLSTDKYLKPVLLLSLFTVSFNIIFNLIFIPSFGYMAAAWITVASEILSFIVFFELLRRKVL